MVALCIACPRIRSLAFCGVAVSKLSRSFKVCASFGNRPIFQIAQSSDSLPEKTKGLLARLPKKFKAVANDLVVFYETMGIPEEAQAGLGEIAQYIDGVQNAQGRRGFRGSAQLFLAERSKGHRLPGVFFDPSSRLTWLLRHVWSS